MKTCTPEPQREYYKGLHERWQSIKKAVDEKKLGKSHIETKLVKGLINFVRENTEKGSSGKVVYRVYPDDLLAFVAKILGEESLGKN